MLDVRQLRSHILALDDRDDALRRQALHSLRDHDEQEWATAPIEVSHSLVKALRSQLLNGGKQPFAQKEVVTILGNMGSRAKSALPQLIELLGEDVPGPVRQAAIHALGNIGCADNGVRSALVDLWLSPMQLEGGKAQVAQVARRLSLTKISINLF